MERFFDKVDKVTYSGYSSTMILLIGIIVAIMIYDIAWDLGIYKKEKKEENSKDDDDSNEEEGAHTLHEVLSKVLNIGMVVISIITIIALALGAKRYSEYSNNIKKEEHKQEEKYVEEYSGDTYEYKVNNGYISVKYTGNKTNLIVVAEKIRTSKDKETGEEVKELDDNNYNCYIYNDGFEHNIILSKGTGEYYIAIYECEKETVNKVEDYRVKYSSENKELYKISSYNVETEKYKRTVKKIIDENNWSKETDMSSIFEYFKSYEYDSDTESKIKDGDITTYDIDLDKTYGEHRGICMNIASLETAVLRELGYSAKLEIGKVNNTYHAWSEVYYKGKWENMDVILKDTYRSKTEDIEVYQTY